MGKMEYLDALKRAMAGLPPETQAKTLAYYEQRFVDGHAAGRSAEDIYRELDDPKKVAMTLRTSAHLETFKETKSPASLLRLFFSAVGLAIFNLFMVVPAAVFGALLMVLYICSLTFYVAGIGITASGLAGANEIVINEPLRQASRAVQTAEPPVQTRIVIGPGGIRGSTSARPSDGDSGADEQKARVTFGSEKMSGGRILITTEMDEESRATQIAVGLGMVLAGILTCLLSLVVTRYTLVGIKRYVQMNLSLLKGN
jgi:uncharacterized membrane protein